MRAISVTRTSIKLLHGNPGLFPADLLVAAAGLFTELSLGYLVTP